MIDAVERVRTFVANLISSLGGRMQRSLSQDCSWLNTKLDEFTKIAVDISRKLEIVELATAITSAKIDSCTAQEVAELQKKNSELGEISEDLKYELGQPETKASGETVMSTNTNPITLFHTSPLFSLTSSVPSYKMSKSTSVSTIAATVVTSTKGLTTTSTTLTETATSKGQTRTGTTHTISSTTNSSCLAEIPSKENPYSLRLHCHS